MHRHSPVRERADTRGQNTASESAAKYIQVGASPRGSIALDKCARGYAWLQGRNLNQGNALLFRGQYDAAIERYERALELKPDWQPARTNRDIALARAKLLETEGGEGTDGKLGADDYVITNTPKGPSPEGEQEETVDGGQLSDAELRAVWLRQVQTNPADFLKSKFHYQAQQQAKEAAQ